MNVQSTPSFVIWDMTYACPLRCEHCYSESGRRASKQLKADDLFRVTDALIALKPPAVVLSGGEPLLVKEIFEIAERLFKAGIEVQLYTSGWSLDPTMIPAIMRVCSKVAVSVDGATAKVHDRIRGRAGSYDRAMTALQQLNDAIRDRRRRGERTPFLGIDVDVTQSNFDQLRDICTVVVPQFSELDVIFFGAVLPTGLATRVEYVEQEMVTEEQASLLAGSQLAKELQSLVPASVEVGTSDNRRLQMHPDHLAAGTHFPVMQVEPDAMVRAMAIYEGTVGSLLTEPAAVLWERAKQRWTDPFVMETLEPARTMKAWAEAARRIDRHFGSAEDRARIARRPLYMVAA